MIGRIEFDVGVSDLICTRLGAELGPRGGDCSQTAPQDSQESRVRGKLNNNVKFMDGILLCQFCRCYWNWMPIYKLSIRSSML